MNEELEELLKRYRNDPSPGVKKEVLNRFKHTFKRESSPAAKVAFWRRPVPLYLAAAIIIIASGSSFIAGRNTHPEREYPPAQAERQSTQNESISLEVTWEIAPADLL